MIISTLTIPIRYTVQVTFNSDTPDGITKDDFTYECFLPGDTVVAIPVQSIEVSGATVFLTVPHMGVNTWYRVSGTFFDGNSTVRYEGTTKDPRVVISSSEPEPGETIDPLSGLTANIVPQDDAIVDASTITLTLNSTSVTPTIQDMDGYYRVTYSGLEHGCEYTARIDATISYN